MTRLTSLLTILLWASSSLAADRAAKLEFFERKIRPVLVKHCYQCHSSKAKANKKLKGGLQLDRHQAAMAGGDSGRVIVPGKPQASLLIKALNYDSLQMPPNQRLPKRVVADFARWIKEGAAWPAEKAPTKTKKNTHNLKDFAYWRKNHWAWKPIQSPTVPRLANDNWSRNAIDRFVLARLRKAGLKPSAAADHRTLHRRIKYDLTGLPPTYSGLQQFESDHAPGAYERLVDRLLSSPAFGEKWGRHWLDIARYADNGGFNSQTSTLYTEFHYAYTYRDYVVRAMNSDLPYDRFIIEQLAADQLKLGDDNRALAALGFLTVGDKSFGISYHDRIDDCIDTVTRGLMAITVSCARCHDHKYDPIPTADYYALHSVFHNSQINRPASRNDINKCNIYPTLFADKDERKQFNQRLAAERKRHQAVVAKFGKSKSKRSKRAIAKSARQLQKVEFGPPRAMVTKDRKNLAIGFIFLRGNPGKRGPLVVRHFLRLMSNGSPEMFVNGSGRLDLAKAIVDPSNPLTARVIVNRVWQRYFGVGLVRSSGDFGTRSDAPSHPQLLDYLASQLIAEGWSLKKLHRRILLSSTFRQASAPRKNALAKDPTNRLLWRMNRRRLSFEELRDSLLRTSNSLARQMGGYPKPTWKMARRTLYGYIDRYRIAVGYEMFDFPYPGRTAVKRSQTLVPQQSLFLMNSRFVQRQATKVAAMVAAHASADQQIKIVFQQVLNRDPTNIEMVSSERLLKQFDSRSQWQKLCHALFLSNEFMYVD